ncbi:hypothetical protein BRETT_004779 [Brettanomyces bruxellensis]|uniref:Pre-mRNA-splicing factor CWC25 n=1 Tax=Dekkera bruxellensis TaxID=5007 RepID=A0A871R8M5_DEKBR|nr:uncharacterized protein BRETT_004779 [Brettanomyces bruxellensis]QOU20128.1 hypothetical protein BRETT_004779 [Brettanomyces bruxellensis]
MPDLNLKKSWNPKLLKNRAKVWKREQEVLQRYKKSRERELQIQEQQDRSNLLQLNSLKKGETPNQIDAENNYKTGWIYKNELKKNESTQSTGSSREDIMLGRKRLDEMLKNKKERVVVKCRFDDVVNAFNINDVKKSDEGKTVDKEDPLYKIQMAQQNSYHRSKRNSKIYKPILDEHRYRHQHHHHHHHHHHQRG